MAAFEILGTYTNGSVIDGPEIADEFDNIYEAWNGTSTDKEIEHKFSGSEPALIIDQLGSGKILSARVDGVELASIENTGKIVSPNVLVDKFSWFIQDPNSVSGTELLKVFIVPDGTSMRITKFSILRRQGGHGGGTSVAFRLQQNGVNVGSGISFSDTNNLADTEYSETLNVSAVADDIFRITITTGGVPSERAITIIMEWEQRLG